MSFFKRNYETIKSLAIIIGAIVYLHHYLDHKFSLVESRFDSIEKRLTKIETIMIMNGTMFPSVRKCSEVQR